MSRRGYKLDRISVDFTSFEDMARKPGELSFANCSLSRPLNQGDEEDMYWYMNALATLRLIECNPHVKKLIIAEIDNEDEECYAINNRMINYLGQHCREVKDVEIYNASIEAIRLAMASFPNLTNMDSNIRRKNGAVPAVGEVTCYPSIESFHFSSQDETDYETMSALVKACPNLTYLDCGGGWMFYGLKEALMSCSKLKYLSLCGNLSDNHHGTNRLTVSTMLLAIVEHGLQLQDLSLYMGKLDFDLRKAPIRYSLKRIIQRVRELAISVRCFVTNAHDPETSIGSLFSSPGVDLRSLHINTYDESADQIAMLLQGCRNVSKLFLQGKANISEVLMKISAKCHQLVELSLYYDVSISGKAMLTMLQSCRQLRSLALSKACEIQAYEALAMHGGNLTNLSLYQRVIPGTIAEFEISSPIYDTDFKQQPQRTHPMALLCAPGLNVKSLAKFLSSFGVIQKLSLQLHPSQMPSDFEVDMYEDTPIYHAREVIISAGTVDRIDAVFLAMMTACRSLRQLNIHNSLNSSNIETSSFITCAIICKMKKNPLEWLSYPWITEIPEATMKQLLPTVKIKR
jgi:hypothetical protein